MTHLKADHFWERPLHNLAIPAIGGIQELLLGDRWIAVKSFLPSPIKGEGILQWSLGGVENHP